jgi:hypothetical protein
MSTATATRIETRARVGTETVSLTDHIWLLDLKRDYGEVRGLEMFIERSSELDLARLRSGDPRATSYRDKDGRLLSHTALDALADRLEEKLRSLKPGWLTRTGRPAWETASAEPGRLIHRDGRGTGRDTVPKRPSAAAELARELKERKRSLGSSWTITDTTIELSNPDYRDEVVLSPEARAAIEDAVYHSRIGALETGGPLGGSWSSRRRMNVTLARGAGGARRGYKWIKLGGELHKFEDEIEDTPGVDFVGSWHSHPSGRAQPSENDMITWAKTLDGVERRHGTSTFIGMIAAPSRDWQSGIGRMAIPTLHAWLVRRVSPSLVTCERADVSP